MIPVDARTLTTSWPDWYTRLKRKFGILKDQLESSGFAYAKENMSTFWTAATGEPSMVMFVNGVFWSLSFPYQSIARATAWPPSQLQLKSLSPRYHQTGIYITYLISASPAWKAMSVDQSYLLGFQNSPKEALSNQNLRALIIPEAMSLHPGYHKIIHIH